MNKLFEHIGLAITSMAAVIFVLILTLLGLLMFTHTLFYDVLPQTITGWERQVASWTLALAWEFTLLTTTVNTQFLNRRIPIVAAIASGITVLFFIEAFAFDQPLTELLQRWFTGFLITFVNLTYTELFYAKWKDMHLRQDLSLKITELEQVINSQTIELAVTHDRLKKANSDFERIVDYVAELEAFKKSEMDKVTCSFCAQVFSSVYVLASHRTNCNSNPRNRQRDSVFEAVA
jgi:hypothetical protein